MPAKRNVVQASRTTSVRAPHSARGPLRRALTLPVVALVLVAVVPGVVVLVSVEVNAVEDHRHALRVTGLQGFERALRMGAARHFPAMPMIDDTASRQQHRIFSVRQLLRRQVVDDVEPAQPAGELAYMQNRRARVIESLDRPMQLIFAALN